MLVGDYFEGEQETQSVLIRGSLTTGTVTHQDGKHFAQRL